MRRRRCALALGILLLACDGRPRAVAMAAPEDGVELEEGAEPRAGSLLEFDLSRGVPESTDGTRLFALPAARTYAGLIRAIERAERETDAAGFFVKVGEQSFGWAKSEELGGLFERLGERTEKPVVCHAHSLDNATAWFVARGCDRIWISPAGDVETIGIAAQVVHFKDALDKLHIQADMLQMGRYKSAVESFTRSEPSEAAREALEGVLRSTRETWLAGMAAARATPGAREMVERGPWTAEDAKERGLIDGISYETDARKDARRESRALRVTQRFGPERRRRGFGVADIVRMLTGVDPPAAREPHVVVVPAQGAISMRGGGLLATDGITARALSRILKRLAENDAVKAVVLRIDSPGGSAFASDFLWHELMELRKKKPLIASVGGMAASGGYYMAAAANRVVAERTSIVGSIGVFGGKLVIGDALARLGIESYTIAASPEPGAAERAAYLSPLIPWDEATREKVRRKMEQIYELFLERVARGRDMPLQAVRAAAEGRIWSGAQGMELKLVDDLGGLSTALSIARELASLDADAPVRVEGAVESLLETLLLDGDATQPEVEAALERLSKRREALAAIPEAFLPHVASLQPLLDGETVLAAMPFAVVLR